MAGYTAIANGETGASIRGKINTQFNELFGENAKSVIVCADSAAILAIPSEYLTTGKIAFQIDTGIFYQWDGAAWTVFDCQVNNLTVNSVNFGLDPTVTMAEGVLAWDKDAGTLMLGMPGGNVNLQLGQEIHIRAVNGESTTITNGTVVYIFGASGSKPVMKRADANTASANATIAIATEDVDAGKQGYFTTFGLVRDVNTDGLGAGSVLYLSETAGQYTDVAPDKPAHQIKIGYVIVDNPSSGVIFARIDAIPDLSELCDVSVLTPSAGQILRVNDSGTVWENTDPKFGVDISSGNYSEFEDDGTLKFNGDATVWKDLIISGAQLRNGASAPTFAAFTGGIYALRFDAGSAHEAHGAIELQHDYKEGTALDLHIHWTPTTTNTGNIVWGVEYAVGQMGATYGAASTHTITPLAAPGIIGRHVLTDIVQIPGTGMKIGAIINFRVFRQNGGTDTFTGNAFLHSVGIHYEVDTVGSRQETVK